MPWAPDAPSSTILAATGTLAGVADGSNLSHVSGPERLWFPPGTFRYSVWIRVTLSGGDLSAWSWGPAQGPLLPIVGNLVPAAELFPGIVEKSVFGEAIVRNTAATYEPTFTATVESTDPVADVELEWGWGILSPVQEQP